MPAYNRHFLLDSTLPFHHYFNYKKCRNEEKESKQYLIISFVV